VGCVGPSRSWSYFPVYFLEGAQRMVEPTSDPPSASAQAPEPRTPPGTAPAPRRGEYPPSPPPPVRRGEGPSSRRRHDEHLPPHGGHDAPALHRHHPVEDAHPAVLRRCPPFWNPAPPPPGWGAGRRGARGLIAGGGAWLISDKPPFIPPPPFPPSPGVLPSLCPHADQSVFGPFPRVQ